MKSVAEYLLTTGISALVMSVVLVACGSTSAIKPPRTAEAVVPSPAPQHEVAMAADLRDSKRGTSVAKARSNP